MTDTLVIGSPLLRVTLLPLGATIHRIEVPDRDGLVRDVAAGHRDPADYATGEYFRGGVIGRFANRIAGGRFDLDGRIHHLATTDRGNHLHGEPDGYHRRAWRVVRHDAAHAVLELLSPDGDQGFPGELRVSATYRVEGSTLSLDLAARTSAPTVVNLTNHVYLDLDADPTATIDDHTLEVRATTYLPVDDTGIPRGGPIAADPFPFVRGPHTIAGTVADHTFVLTGPSGRPREAAVLASPRTGIRMRLHTDQPGLQVYTGEHLDRPRSAIALEAQHFPDSPNRPDFPSTRLEPGEVRRAVTSWTFDVVGATSPGDETDRPTGPVRV